MKLIFEICLMYNPCKSHLLYDSGVQGEALRQNMIRQTCETKVVSKAGKHRDYYT